jgi:hypothetical protein
MGEPLWKKKPEDRVIESWDDQMQNPPVSSPLWKKNVFPNGSSTASTKTNAQVHWKFVNLRRLSETSGRTLMLNARGTGGPVSRMDIQTWASNYWMQWQVQNVTSWPRS